MDWFIKESPKDISLKCSLTVLDTYAIETYSQEEISFIDTDVKGYFIDVNDITRLKTKRTRLKEVKTKIELLYHYDYGHGNHLKTTADNEVNQKASELFVDYKNSYYGISDEQGESPIELNYIRDDFTANELHKYLFYVSVRG